MDLLIVIVNYRTANLVVDCLRSLAPQISQLRPTQVIVVDNNSQDKSILIIRQAICTEGWTSWVQILALEDNLGFAGGNNRAIKSYPGSRYLLLLNSDTIVHPGCLDYCFKMMEQDQMIGALSCKLFNQDLTTQNVTRKFPTPLRMTCSALGLPWHLPKLFGWADTEDLTWDRRHVKRDVDWIGGAFMMLRGSMIEKIGLLDEDFFFYGEDIELCHRISQAGWRCHYDPAVSITHLGGGSSDPSRITSLQRNKAFWQARYLVQRKCFGWLAAYWLSGLDLFACIMRLFVLFCMRRKQTQRYKEILGLFRFLKQEMNS